MNTGIVSKLFGVALAMLIATGPVTAQTADRAEVLAATTSALSEGKAAQALVLSTALVARNSKDIDALLLKARAHALLGQPREARAAAQQAFNVAKGIKAARYDAAITLADIAAGQRNYGQSQFWLRRAMGLASSDEQVKYVGRVFRGIRAKNPVSFAFSFGAAPNPNINNGSSVSNVVLGGNTFTINPDGRDLSGYTANGSARVVYRFAQTERSSTSVALSASARMNWFDRRAANEIAAAFLPGDAPRLEFPGFPGIYIQTPWRTDTTGIPQHTDWDQHNIGLSLQHNMQLDDRGTLLNLTTQVGRSWYGWEKYTNYINAGGQLSVPVSENGKITVSASGQRNFYFANPRWSATVDETILRGRLAYDHALPWDDKVSVGVDLGKAFSANPNQVFVQPGAFVGYDIAKPILGARLSFGGSVNGKFYDSNVYTGTTRLDRTLSGSVSAEFVQFSYFGFSPVVTVQASRTFSDVPQYDRQSLTAGFSLQSRF